MTFILLYYSLIVYNEISLYNSLNWNKVSFCYSYRLAKTRSIKDKAWVQKYFYQLYPYQSQSRSIIS